MDLTTAGLDVVWMFGYTGTPNDTGTVATFLSVEDGHGGSAQMFVAMRNKIFKNGTFTMNVPPLMGPCGEEGYKWMKLIDMTNNTDLALLVMPKENMDTMTRSMCPTLPDPFDCSNKTYDDDSSNFTCTKLTDGFGVCWAARRKFGQFVLCANDIGPGEYMAFGWSRNVKKTAMLKADAVVCSHQADDTWDVEDYYLESRQPCGRNFGGEATGVCPDSAFGEESNIAGTSGQYENGVGYCSFRRWLYTSRKHDMKITVIKRQAILWATGPIGVTGQIQKHSTRSSETQFFSFAEGGQQCGLNNPYCCCRNLIQE